MLVELGYFLAAVLGGGGGFLAGIWCVDTALDRIQARRRRP